MAEKLHAKMVINTIGYSPEKRKEMIERAKIELMKELLTRYPSDEYQGIAFHIEGLTVGKVAEHARRYRREDGEWYWRGERVRPEQIFEMVRKGLFEVHVEAWIEKRSGEKEIDHGQMGMRKCQPCGCGDGAEV